MRQIAGEFASSKTLVRKALIAYGIPLPERWWNPYRNHNLPFGKRLIKGRVVEQEREQIVIQSILEMKRLGFSNQKIADALHAIKTPTKKRGKTWHSETVRQILSRYFMA